jgi:type IV fimbrial biogenesis protein FimT
MFPTSRQRGFSLLELMAATTVSAILLSVSVPGLRKFVLDARRTAVVNELLTSAQLARMASITRSGYVTMCPSVNGTTCSASTADWKAGWIVYSNLDRDFSGAEPDAGEPVLRYFPNDNPGVQVSSGGRRSFSFRPFQINSDNGTITVCDERGSAVPSERRAIIINTVGRPRISTRKSDGSALECPT